MFKTLITTIIITTIAFPAMAQGGHEGHDHSIHDHNEHDGHDHLDHDHSQHDGHDHSSHKHDHKPELIITPIAPKQLKSGEKNEVSLFIQDIKAKPVDVSQFEVVHTKPVHLLIIEPGLKDYHHEHSVQKAKGMYSFNFTPNTACGYRIWVDVQLKGGHQHYYPIDVKGAEVCDTPIDKTVNIEASSQGYDFKMELEGDLKVGKAVFANMSISKDGQPVDLLEPVMGAFAHMVGFYEDYETIAHIHSVDKEPKQTTERGGPTLRFHIEPEQAGYLKLFAQFQINGKQIFVPFGLMIKKGNRQANEIKHDNHGH